MGDDIMKKLLTARRNQVGQAGTIFLEAICGDTQAVGKRLATQTARERGRMDVASIIDADFEEEKGTYE